MSKKNWTSNLTLGIPGDSKWLPRIFWFLITVILMAVLGTWAWTSSTTVVDDVISSEPAAIIVDKAGDLATSISEGVGSMADSAGETASSLLDSAKDMVGLGPDTIDGEPVPIETVEPEPVEADVPPTE